MIVKCGACREDIEIQDGIADGTHIRCPYCNETTVFRVPSRIELSKGISNQRVAMRNADTANDCNREDKPRHFIRRASVTSAPSNVGARQIMERIQNKEKMEMEERARAKSEQRNFAIAISLLVLIVIGALVIYWWETQHSLATSVGPVDDESIDNTERVREWGKKDSGDARRLEEYDAERERKRREADAERARRKAEADAEREKKRQAREKELQEQREKAEAEKANRERIEEVERKFKSASYVFASDFAGDKSPIKKDGTFYAIGLDYISVQKIYEAMVERGTIVAVRAFSPKGEPIDVDVKEFNDGVMGTRLLAMGEDGVAWVLGTGKSSWTENVSLSDEEIMPAKRELGELFPILSGWGCLPDLKYRLTLKCKKKGVQANGGADISLGIIEYGASISSGRIRDAVLKLMQKKREKSANLQPPKLKKFTPTVVFYDGDIIRKELKMTKVPRHFKHLGTKRYGTVKHTTYDQAEEQWKRLKAEAERQERKKEEILRENAQIMREHEEKVRAILSKGISGEQIEAEVQKYVLLIERSRSRLPK